MAAINDRIQRQTIPQWNIFEKSKEDNHNFTPIFEIQSRNKAELHKEIEKWKSNKSEFNTAKICSLKIVHGAEDIEIENYIIEQKWDNLLEIIQLGKKCENQLLESSDFSNELCDLADNYISRVIYELNKQKKILNRNFDNPLSLALMSFFHNELGNLNKSKLFFERAVKNGNSNLTILRILSIIAFNSANSEIAEFWLKKLRSSPYIKNQAWLMSNEISFSMKLNVDPRYFSRAKQLALEDKSNIVHKQELLASLGTLLSFSNIKKANEYLKSAVRVPINTVIPQVEYVQTKTGIILREDALTLSNEAHFFSEFNKGSWDSTTKSLLGWVKNEPYNIDALRTATAYSYSILNDNRLSIKFAEIGIRKDPDNFHFLSSLAFSYAVENDLEKATNYIKKINPNRLNNNQNTIYLANLGLILYKSNYYDKGRECYLKAEEISRKDNDMEGELLVKIFHIRARLSVNLEEILTAANRNVLMTGKNSNNLEIRQIAVDTFELFNKKIRQSYRPH